jgi:hypothetical protein
MKQQIKRALELVFVPIAAAIVFFEQVLIHYLNVGMAAFARLPWIARFEAWLLTLPPYAALLAFGLPSLLILPIKIITVWFGLHGKYSLAVGTLIAAKVLGTAILARLYRILQPKLMAIPWFAWADTHFFLWRDRIYGFVKSLAAWRRAAALIERLRTWLTGLVSGLFAR